MSDRRRTSPALLLALLGMAAFGAAACGDDPASSSGADGGDPATGQFSRVLTRVGPSILEVNPGDVLSLQALLSQREVGPVAGATVTWQMVNDPTWSSSGR